MREIKFRALDIVTKKFVYGQLVNVSCTKDSSPQTAWRIVERGLDCIIHTPVNPETVGQFTGLKDRKGVEIYEGDIVKEVYKIGEHIEGVIEIGNFKIDYGSGSYFPEDTFYGVNISGKPMNRWKKYEVIGNIYEHPELLTK
jgi:uncharacterized phage protein (TIGR01671 family)